MNNAELNARIDELWAQTKRGELPRADRFKAVEALTDGYVQNTGKRPPAQALDRLATLCLYEEITDPHPDKMAREETPIMSDNQYRRKTEGRHVRRTDKEGNLRPLNREVPLGLAQYVATDGRNYETPHRRTPDVQEQLDMELHGRSTDNDD